VGDTIVYYPDDIKEFRFGKRSYYATMDMQIDSMPTKLFARCVVEGLACLYHTRQGIQDYYILERNGNRYNLSNDAKIVKYNPGSIAESRTYGGGDDFVQHSKQYIGMLSVAFSDCPQLKKEINNLDFSLNKMVKITRKYNTLMTPQVKSPH
jgi:hypothetical protein